MLFPIAGANRTVSIQFIFNIIFPDEFVSGDLVKSNTIFFQALVAKYKSLLVVLRYIKADYVFIIQNGLQHMVANHVKSLQAMCVTAKCSHDLSYGTGGQGGSLGCCGKPNKCRKKFPAWLAFAGTAAPPARNTSHTLVAQLLVLRFHPPRSPAPIWAF